MIGIFGLLMQVGCMHAHHLTTMSDIHAPEDFSQGRLVESEANQVVVLGLASDTNFVVDAYRDLGLQCPDGTVTGIQSRYSTALNFMRWEHTVRMWGYCFD